MKSQNYDHIRKAIISFALYLTASVVMATCFFFFFMKTSSFEVSLILKKVDDYNLILSKQMDLTEKMDTLYFYASVLDPDHKINYKLMQNSLSDRKIQFTNALTELSDKDCLLYKRLASRMNIIFDTKDSIIMATTNLNTIKEDLLRCTSENRKVTRKISTGGLTFDK